jgi:serine protease Do
MPALILLSLFLALPAAAQTAAPDTPDLYAEWHDRVVQVQVIDQQAQSKAGIGSGFFAGNPGWVVTNYHVIADLANEPGRYQAHYRTENGREGRLALLSVDAVHDLAVLRAEGLAPEALHLAPTPPPKGSRLFSLGYPYDIGLTIVEGTYNGFLDKSLYEKLHFTGSINPGMSGGPALDRSGEVVGINVSTAGNQVSFLVPIQYAAKLIESTRNEPAGADHLNELVAGQLLKNQEQISSSLLAGEVPKTRLNGYLVPAALAPYISCWGNSQEDRPDELDLVSYSCQTQDDIFLSQELYTGAISYQHELLSTDRLHPLRFFQQLENRSYYPQLRLEGDELSVTNYRCHSDFVNQSGLTFKATFCIRRYRKFDGLYDSYLSLTSLVDKQEALQSSLVLAGFSWDNIEKLSALFIRSIGAGR